MKTMETRKKKMIVAELILLILSNIFQIVSIAAPGWYIRVQADFESRHGVFHTVFCSRNEVNDQLDCATKSWRNLYSDTLDNIELMMKIERQNFSDANAGKILIRIVRQTKCKQLQIVILSDETENALDILEYKHICNNNQAMAYQNALSTNFMNYKQTMNYNIPSVVEATPVLPYRDIIHAFTPNGGGIRTLSNAVTSPSTAMYVVLTYCANEVSPIIKKAQIAHIKITVIIGHPVYRPNKILHMAS